MTQLPSALSTLLLFATLGGVASAQQPVFTMIPGATSATDITPNRSIIVGTLNSGAGGYVWRWKQDPAPIAIGGSWAVAVSDDGTRIAGGMTDPGTGKEVAAVWKGDPATGVGTWTILNPGQLSTCDAFQSSPSDISGDGTLIAGGAWEGCSGRGFVADTTAITPFTQMLEGLANGHNRATAISNNGKWIGGFAQGTFSRTPAVWDPNAPLITTGFPDYYPGYNHLGAQDVFDANVQGEIHGFSEDGSTLLGEWINAAGTNIDAFYWPNWDGDTTMANFQFLGSLNPGWNGQAVAMLDPQAGSSTVPELIIGYDSLGLGAEAWVWTQASGIQQLRSLLISQGVPSASVPDLAYCNAIASKSGGKTIVGHTVFVGAWIVDYPAPDQVTVYGCDNPPPAGDNPVGSMTVLSGSPVIGQTLTLGLDNPLATQASGAFPFVVLATLPAPGFPCGTALPGFGMSGGAGELLIDIVTPPNPILPAIPGNPWAGPGFPASVQLQFPPNTNLIGKKLFGQGVLLDFSPFATVPVGLTDAVELTIGG